MTYQSYVVAAYMVFVVVLLWDFVAPRIQLGQLLRAARLRAMRDQSTHPTFGSGNPLPDPSLPPARE